jgi:hypothetical protein
MLLCHLIAEVENGRDIAFDFSAAELNLLHSSFPLCGDPTSQLKEIIYIHRGSLFFFAHLNFSEC